MKSSLRRSVLRSALITGAIGLGAGFFGLVVFTPDSDHGPLLAIAVTALLSLLGGAIGGVIYWFANGQSR